MSYVDTLIEDVKAFKAGEYDIDVVDTLQYVSPNKTEEDILYDVIKNPNVELDEYNELYPIVGAGLCMLSKQEYDEIYMAVVTRDARAHSVDDLTKDEFHELYCEVVDGNEFPSINIEEVDKLLDLYQERKFDEMNKLIVDSAHYDDEVKPKNSWNVFKNVSEKNISKNSFNGFKTVTIFDNNDDRIKMLINENYVKYSDVNSAGFDKFDITVPGTIKDVLAKYPGEEKYAKHSVEELLGIHNDSLYRAAEYAKNNNSLDTVDEKEVETAQETVLE